MSDKSVLVTKEQEADVDSKLAKLDCFKGSRELRLSPLLDTKFVLASNYIKSFPQHAIVAENKLLLFTLTTSR